MRYLSHKQQKALTLSTGSGLYNLMRDEYETKAYIQSNDAYPFPTPYYYRTTPCTSLYHLGEPT